MILHISFTFANVLETMWQQKRVICCWNNYSIMNSRLKKKVHSTYVPPCTSLGLYVYEYRFFRNKDFYTLSIEFPRIHWYKRIPYDPINPIVHYTHIFMDIFIEHVAPLSGLCESSISISQVVHVPSGNSTSLLQIPRNGIESEKRAAAKDEGE